MVVIVGDGPGLSGELVMGLVLYSSAEAWRRAPIRRVHPHEAHMTPESRLLLVKESLELLRQFKVDLHSESHHGFALVIGEVIEKLEDIERDGMPDQGRLDLVIEMLGTAFAALPSVLEFIKSIGGG